MKKLMSLAVAFCLTFIMPVSAYAAPAESGQEMVDTNLPSGISISELEEQIDTLTEENKETTAAMSVAVFQHDTLLFEKAYGYTNIENNLKTSEDFIIFRYIPQGWRREQ